MPQRKQAGGFNMRSEPDYDEPRRNPLFERRGSLFDPAPRPRPLFNGRNAARVSTSTTERQASVPRTSLKKEFDFCNTIATTAQKEFFLVELDERIKDKYFVGAVAVTFGSTPIANLKLKFNAVRLFLFRDTTPFSEWKLLSVQVADNTVGKNWSWLAQDGEWTDVVSTKEWRAIVGGRSSGIDIWYPKTFLSYTSYRNQTNTGLYQQYGKMDKFHTILLALGLLYGSIYFTQEAKAQHFVDTQYDLMKSVQEVVDAVVLADDVSRGFKSTLMDEITNVAYDTVVKGASRPQRQQTRPRESQATEEVYDNASGIHFKVSKNFIEKRRRRDKGDDGRGAVTPKYGKWSSLFGR